jgi:hypothetical protein
VTDKSIALIFLIIRSVLSPKYLKYRLFSGGLGGSGLLSGWFWTGQALKLHIFGRVKLRSGSYKKTSTKPTTSYGSRDHQSQPRNPFIKGVLNSLASASTEYHPPRYSSKRPVSVISERKVDYIYKGARVLEISRGSMASIDSNSTWLLVDSCYKLRVRTSLFFLRQTDYTRELRATSKDIEISPILVQLTPARCDSVKPSLEYSWIKLNFQRFISSTYQWLISLVS